MCAPFLSSELALRVGLAARALEGYDAKTLLPALIDKFGLPLTKDKFSKVTVTTLKDALTAQPAEEPRVPRAMPGLDSLKDAVRYLWGFGDEDADSLPPLSADADYAPEGSVRVAFATSDGETVDEHFGGCLRFHVYQVSVDEAKLIDYRSTAESVDAEDPSAFRAELLQDCHLMYVQSIGGPAAAKVIQRGIYPLKTEGREALNDLLGRLQSLMAGSPPPWLAKVMKVPVEDRIRFGTPEPV